MNPYSARYFIKENKKRSVTLVLLMSALVFVYISGIYITSLEAYNLRCNSMYKDFAYIAPSHESTQEEFKEFVNQSCTFPSVSTVIPVNLDGCIRCRCEMGSYVFSRLVTFCKEKDFKAFLDITGHKGIATNVDRGIVISKALADNTGVSVGDSFDENSDIIQYLPGRYYISQIINSNKLFAYCLNSSLDTYSYIALRQKATASTSLATTRNNLLQDFKSYLYQHSIHIVNYEYIVNMVTQDCQFLHLIYTIVSILIAFVLAITIQATIIGTYQKRQHEFELYHAIGFSKTAMIFKVCREILFLYIFGLVLCFLLSLVILFLLNTLYYEAFALKLPYLSSSSLITTLLNSLLIIIPVIISRILSFKKISLPE